MIRNLLKKVDHILIGGAMTYTFWAAQGKKIGNSRLRSVLILGARAYVYKLKEPKSSKDRWLKAIIERNGESRAAIALANKNVRTAWAMVTQGTEYQRRQQLELAA